MLFELRQYRIQPGKRDEWVRFMEEEIIPFQVSKGMVVVGSFIAEEEGDLYIWIRRFEDEEDRKALYAAVYESDHWKNVIAPQTATFNIREKMVITRMNPTPKSVIR
jgi:hypothetical protein